MDGWWQRLGHDHQRLARLIRRAALAGAPAVTASLFACGPCPPEDRLYLLRAPDVQTRALIDLCRRPQQPDCQPLCQHLVGDERGAFQHCELHTDRQGYVRVHVGWEVLCPGGRRPEGLRLPAAAPCSPEAGAWLARLAALEAASVPAFLRLEAELTAHGAPQVLVRATRAAAADEIVHARLGAALARRYRGTPLPPVVPASGEVRPLEAMLRENGEEGCVRETFGAMLAARQAATAADPAVRRAFAGIAADETRHAALALATSAWGHTRLGAAGRTRMRRWQLDAMEGLREQLGSPAADETTRALGLSQPPEALRMFDQLRDQLWTIT